MHCQIIVLLTLNAFQCQHADGMQAGILDKNAFQIGILGPNFLHTFYLLAHAEGNDMFKHKTYEISSFVCAVILK